MAVRGCLGSYGHFKGLLNGFLISVGTMAVLLDSSPEVFLFFFFNLYYLSFWIGGVNISEILFSEGFPCSPSSWSTIAFDRVPESPPMFMLVSQLLYRFYCATFLEVYFYFEFCVGMCIAMCSFVCCCA